MLEILYVIMSSIALPVGGVQMQKLWKNQLGDVYSVGLGSAACLGGAFAAATQCCSIFVGSLCACILTSVIGTLVYRSINTSNFITFGMIFGSFIGALATIAANNATPEALKVYYAWAGASFQLSNLNWFDASLSISLFIFGMFCALVSSRELDFGDFSSFYRCFVFFGQSMLVASVISVCGVIGMISLTAPNVARIISRNHSTRNLYLLSSIIGFALLLPTYLITKYADIGLYLPVSATMSIISIPLSIFIFTNQKNGEL